MKINLNWELDEIKGINSLYHNEYVIKGANSLYHNNSCAGKPIRVGCN